MAHLSAATETSWIRGPRLRARWDNMSNSTFYNKLRAGLIPKPHHPFGPATPYWSMAEIEAFERAQASKAVA